MTDTAAEAVKKIVARMPDATDAGVRISDDGETVGFALTIADAPEASDTVVDTDGARVFLDTTAAAALDDQVLDARFTGEGQVSFELAPQT
ncbi:Fe-S cluster assembly protein HesB [Microbacterium sp. AZCO]|uniref:Fe-S cluster assembly protein HesB n=1 Tax=Microbacterium sp. AZCO TaxID=3142976 RepID=UPI0031F3EC10